MAENYDPRVSLPKPNVYATPIGFTTGDVVVHNRQGHIVAGIIDFHSVLYYVLRRHDWPRHLYIILPAKDLDQPQTFAA